MIAAVYRANGDSDVLSVEQVELPVAGPGEVRVRLRVAGVNPTDWKARRARPPAQPFQVPGQDGAGDVDAVGPGVDPRRVGERVWVWFAAAPGRRWGTAAQWTVVPSGQAVRLPDDVGYEVGAGVGIPAMTAWHCVFADGPVEGQSLLVAGGGGAVGHAAVALASRAGARVIATAGTPASAARARSAGAHAVVDRHAPDVAAQVRAAAPGGITRVVEQALGANLELDLAVCAPHAAVWTYADDELRTRVLPLMAANLTLRFVLVYGLSDGSLQAAAAGVRDALAAGALPSMPVLRFRLDEVAEAHDLVEAGASGKVVLDLPD